MSTEKYTIQSQAEHLQMKYVGAGHAEITKFEWLQNQHRDSLASYYGHAHMVQTMAVAQNQSIGRVRYELIQRMLQPVGKSPLATVTADEDDM